MSSESTKLLQQATATFSTVRELIEAAKTALTPREQRNLKMIVSEDTAVARSYMNGRKLLSSKEGSPEEEACIVRLHAVLDDIEADVTEESPIPARITLPALQTAS
jgi:hypothetical protein